MRRFLIWTLGVLVALALCSCSHLSVGVSLDCPALGKVKWVSDGTGPVPPGTTNTPAQDRVIE